MTSPIPPLLLNNSPTVSVPHPTLPYPFPGTRRQFQSLPRLLLRRDTTQKGVISSRVPSHDLPEHTDNFAYTHGRKAPSQSAEAETSRPAKRPALGQFGQSKRPQQSKAPVAPRPEDAKQTTVLRGREWEGAKSASKIVLPEGAVVRVMSHHAVDERNSEWLGSKVVSLDRRAFVFCALHAHMRLTEALVKDMFGRAIEARRVGKLNEAFKRHLGLEHKFVPSQKTKGWNKVSLYGYECWRFAEQDENGVSKIEKVVREVWPDGAGIVKGPSAGSGLCDGQFADAYCELWKLFNLVMLQTRCKDPSNPALAQYGANCRDLGGRWCMLLPSNRCSTFYLHTLVHHGGDFMEYCLQRKLTIGMLENSGAERRHEIGRVQFKKALSGGGKAYRGTREYENRSAYLTLRGLLIWQYGRDMLAEMEAEARVRKLGTPATAASASGTRAEDGWDAAIERRRLQELWAERDKHDESLKLDSVLCDKALRSLDTAKEGDAPPEHVLSEQGRQELGPIDPEVPIVVDDGTVAGGMDPWHDDSESCVSGPPGSECESDWAVDNDDFGDWDFDEPGFTAGSE